MSWISSVGSSFLSIISPLGEELRKGLELPLALWADVVGHPDPAFLSFPLRGYDPTPMTFCAAFRVRPS